MSLVDRLELFSFFIMTVTDSGYEATDSMFVRFGNAVVSIVMRLKVFQSSLRDVKTSQDIGLGTSNLRRKHPQ